MLENFSIRGYKKFDQLELDNLSRVNIILGNNNVGKTTVLEAIYAYARGTDITEGIINSARSAHPSTNVYEFMDALLNMFHTKEDKSWGFRFGGTYSGVYKEIVHFFEPAPIFADLEPNLMGSFGTKEKSFVTGDNKIKYLGDWCAFDLKEIDQYPFLDSVHISFPFSSFELKKLNNEDVMGNTLYPVRFVGFLSHRNKEENYKIYSFLKRGNRGRLVSDFIQELSKTFPDISGIDCLLYPEDVGPIGFMTKNGLLPIYSFGEGLQRWFNLLGGMAVYQDAIHCIEEIDATFHPTAQKELAVNLVSAAEKYNNQLFLTSHSLEFVDNLLEGLYGSDQPLANDCVRIITLRNDEKTNKVKVRVLTGEEAYKSREKYRMELR